VKRPYPFHPPLLGIYPLLSLYAANVSLISWRDILVPLFLTALGSLLLWGFLWPFLRDLQRAAAGASTIIVGFFTFDLLTDAVRMYFGEPVDIDRRAPLWLWTLLVLAAAVSLTWSRKHAPKISLFLNFVAATLCVFSIGSVLLAHWTIRNEIAKRTIDSHSPSSSVSRKPDVIYIVLDGYGRTDVFEKFYGFSDKQFIADLEREGFYVARDARTNYCQTELSLASSLNMAPVEELVEPGDDMTRIRAVLDSRIDDSRVARRFKELGYRYIAITTGFPSLSFETADVQFERDTGATLYLNALLEKTPLPTSKEFIGSQFEQRRRSITGGFKALQDLARPSSTPRFVSVHILAPHPPFVFGANGEEVRPKRTFGFWDGSHYNQRIGTDESYRSGYRAQAQYIAQLLMETLSSFVRRDESEAIILIQGDHGPKSMLDQGSLEHTEINEVFPILSAYRVPESVRKHLYPGISPMNSFRILLSTLFGEKMDKLPDRSYYSTWEKPTAFSEVTSRLSDRGESPLQESGTRRRTESTKPN